MTKRRSTKKAAKAGQTAPRVPLSEDPDMIELKRLVAGLTPDRKAALNDWLEDQQEEEDHETGRKKNS
jgi:hypothetical protein